MPHTITYNKIESVDHVIIKFDQDGDMKVSVRVRLECPENSGKPHKRIYKHSPTQAQRNAILGIVRSLGAKLDVEIPEYAKENKQ